LWKLQRGGELGAVFKASVEACLRGWRRGQRHEVPGTSTPIEAAFQPVKNGWKILTK